MTYKLYSLFFDTRKEALWLKEMSKKGLLLTKRLPLLYYFERSPDPEITYNYRIVYTHDAVENGASDDEINKLKEDGSEFICGYKCMAYFRRPETEGEFTEYDDSKSRLSHFRAIMYFYLISFLASVGVLAYHVDYAIKLHIEEKPMISNEIIAIAVIAVLFFASWMAYYSDKVMFWKKIVKLNRKKIELTDRET